MPDSTAPLPLRIACIGSERRGSFAEALVAAVTAQLGDVPADAGEPAAADPPARWLLLVDRPDLVLADRLVTGEPGKLAQALDAWCDAARGALALAEARGSDVLLLPMRARPADAVALVEALAAWDRRLAGLSVAPPEPPAEDPAAQAVAQRVLRARPDAPRLYEALRAHAARLQPMSIDPVVVPSATPAGAARAILAEADAEPPVVAETDALQEAVERLHETQRELESAYLELQAAQAALRAGTGAPGLLRADHVRLILPEGGPDSQLKIELRRLDTGMRVLPQARAAVVRHDGQPGLRVYASIAEPPIIGAWQTDGSDRNGAFMQWVPALTADRRRLQFLGAADWRMVSGLVGLLRAQAEAAGDALPDAWRLAAAHLARQLDELPARFRYDSLAVDAAAGPDGSSGLGLHFGGACWGALALGSVELVWSPRGLWWLLGSRPASLPLAAWPIAADGTPAPFQQIPVGTPGGTARSHRWASMTDGDRALLLGVLDALPACVARAPEHGAAFGGEARLRAALHALLREAHRALAVGRVRRRLALLPGVGRLLPSEAA